MDKVAMRRVDDEQARSMAYRVRAEQLRTEANDAHQTLKLLCKVHGRTIANRWKNRTKDKRKAFFATAFPEILEKPFDVPPGRIEINKPLTESFMNVEDLSTGSNLISLLAARTLYSLSDWVAHDRLVQVYEGVKYNVSMLLEGDDETYGTVVWHEEHHWDPENGAPRGLVGLSLGVFILDFQTKVINLLMKSARMLLGDDVFKPSAGDLPLNTDDIIDLSTRSPSERYRLRAYTHPVRFSKEDLLNTLLSKLLDVQDNLIFLRTDPIYFHSRLQSKAAHELDKNEKSPKRGNDKRGSSRWNDLMEALIADEYQRLGLWTLAWRHGQTVLGILDEVPRPDADSEQAPSAEAVFPLIPGLENGNPDRAVTIVEHPSVPFRDNIFLPTKEDRALAALELVLECIADKRWMLHDALGGAPPLRHLFRRSKGNGIAADKLTFLRDISRKELGPDSTMDIMELLWNIAEPPRNPRLNEVERLFVGVDELVQKDAHQRGRLTARILSILSELHTGAALLPEIAAHPDRHHTLADNPKQIHKDQILADIDEFMTGTTSTHSLTTMFQDTYLFDGNPPSSSQERKAQKALQATWERVEIDFRDFRKKGLSELYQDQMPPEFVSPGFLPHTYDFTSCAEQPLITIHVKKKHIKTLHILFSPMSENSDIDVSWELFLQAMRAIGFKADRVFGTEWRFIPNNDSPWPAYPISFQEPIPGPKIMWKQARFIVKRLFRQYSLQRSSFILSE
ncbi:hypothetical protein CALCODRAFT_485804 [Calocera cornea HHB12733]|uniref:Uncharacterized protein n=1 Tax=Calocera cornea HHB12733 TaxID=1353952 RepID=A0A165E5A0_9BASI|nr:hypothetical protein CALCODRAFT_485804 [Calocera cornea HHB12733]